MACFLAGCGGGGGFDREAVESELGVTDELLLARHAELCDDTIDEVYAWALLDFQQAGDIESLMPQIVGCEDRYADVADEYGWPAP